MSLNPVRLAFSSEAALLTRPTEIVPSIEFHKVVHSRGVYKPTDPDKDKWKHAKPTQAMDVDRLVVKGVIYPNKQIPEETPFLAYINSTPEHRLAFVRLKNVEEDGKQHVCFERRPLGAPWRLLSYSKEVSEKTLRFLTQHLFGAIDVLAKSLAKR